MTQLDNHVLENQESLFNVFVQNKVISLYLKEFFKKSMKNLDSLEMNIRIIKKLVKTDCMKKLSWVEAEIPAELLMDISKPRHLIGNLFLLNLNRGAVL